jgi:hypothetical protein
MSLWCHTMRRGAGVCSASSVPAGGFGSCRTTQSNRSRHSSRASPGLSDTDRARATVPTRTTSTPLRCSRTVRALSLATTARTCQRPAVPSHSEASTVSMPPRTGG